jgi:hypothetical protein
MRFGRSVATSPALTIAVVRTENPTGLQVVDLKAGKAGRHYTPAELNREGPEMRKSGEAARRFDVAAPAITPDGKYLFTWGDGSAHRFRIEGSRLRLEETGPKVMSDGPPMSLSPDSQYVAVSASSRDGVPAGHVRLGGQGGAYVYAVGNLSKPVLTLQGAGWYGQVGFDFPARRLYATGSNKLLTFAPSGSRQKEYEDRSASTVRQFLVHPAGRKVLVLGTREVAWVEFRAER